METKPHANKKPMGQLEIKEEIQKYLEKNDKDKLTKSMRCSKSNFKREVHSNTGLPQNTRKISNKQPNLTPKRIRKEEQTKSKVSRRKEIIKIRVEIIKTQTKKKKKYKRSIKPRAGFLKR